MVKCVCKEHFKRKLKEMRREEPFLNLKVAVRTLLGHESAQAHFIYSKKRDSNGLLKFLDNLQYILLASSLFSALELGQPIFANLLRKKRERDMVVSKVKYEELRQQRMEENKRKLEDLHLPLLSKALQKASSPNPSPVLNTLSLLHFYLFIPLFLGVFNCLTLLFFFFSFL